MSFKPGFIEPPLACFAVDYNQRRGRRVAEKENPFRSPWQRDRDRVLHSSGFRKLQYKTQVFLNHEGDFFRTRLTHSLEVSQIARSIAISLHVNEDLTEVISLAHDLGHPPFGHSGEAALNTVLRPWNGYDHNIQSLRQISEIEKKYYDFNGLNLTWETLEGLAKHHGPVKRPHPWLVAFDKSYPLNLKTFSSVEAQIAAICDDVAYHGHDLDDGLRAGLIDFNDLKDISLIAECLEEIERFDWSHFNEEDRQQRMRSELVRRIINRLVNDIILQTEKNLTKLNPKTSNDIRIAKKAVVSFSEEMGKKNKEIKKFLFDRMYCHWRVMRMSEKAKRVICEIYEILANNLRLLPSQWQDNARRYYDSGDEDGWQRVIADYIAGMSDRSAMEEHRRLTDLSVLG